MEQSPTTPDTPEKIDFSCFVSPRAVAIIGASSNLSHIGGQPLRLLMERGYKGKVYPVNPRHKEINGLQCYPNIGAVPKPCDVALIALSAPRVADAVEQCGVAGIPFAIVHSSGFSEVGAEGKLLQEQLTARARASGVRVIGPNCLGVLNVKDNVRNGFGGVMRQTDFIPGPFAMITQSGGFGFGQVPFARYYGVGFNYVLHMGNEADISTLDLAEYFLEKEDVEGVFLFMEGVDDGRRLMRLGKRALELRKPVLVWKIGNTDIGRRAAASHSSRMVAQYEIFQAAFRQAGLVEIFETDELIDTLKLFRSCGNRLPAGRATAIVATSGGACVLFSDLCIKQGLELPGFAASTTAELRAFLPSFASVANPVDATAAGNNEGNAALIRSINTVIADPNVNQLIVRIPNASGSDVAQGIADAARVSGKPIVVCWPIALGEKTELLRLYEESGIPCIGSASRTVRALANLNDFAQNIRNLETQPAQAAPRLIKRQTLELPSQAGTLGEHHSKQLLKTYGIPIVAETLLPIAAIAKLDEAPLPLPLAIKIESPDIPHKTEAGVVRLNINGLAELKAAANEIVASAHRYDSQAHIEGISIQEMAAGLEVIIGVVNDANFGPVVVTGLGGIYAEVFKDITHGFAPFDVPYAKQMIDRLKCSSLFHGYRGQPALDVDALAEALSRLSLLATDHAERIAEIDINPLFLRPAGQGVVAADALIVLK